MLLRRGKQPSWLLSRQKVELHFCLNLGQELSAVASNVKEFVPPRGPPSLTQLAQMRCAACGILVEPRGAKGADAIGRILKLERARRPLLKNRPYRIEAL